MSSDSKNGSSINLNKIAKDPSMEDKAFLPLYVVGNDMITANEKLQMRLDDVTELVEGGVPAANIHLAVSDFGDADGRGCAAVYMNKYDGTDTEVVYIPSGHRKSSPDPIPTLKKVIDVAPDGATVTFTDISPNEDSVEEFVEVMTELAEKCIVKIRDHHNWPNEGVAGLRDVVDSLVVEHRPDAPVCATQLTVREDYIDAPKHIKELAYVTAVRDLWIDDNPEFDGRGADLVDFAFQCDYGEYAPTVAEYGPNITEDDEIREMLEEQREEKEAKIEVVADAADWHRMEFEKSWYVIEDTDYDPENRSYLLNTSITADRLPEACDDEVIAEVVMDAADSMNEVVSIGVSGASVSDAIDGIQSVVGDNSDEITGDGLATVFEGVNETLVREENRIDYDPVSDRFVIEREFKEDEIRSIVEGGLYDWLDVSVVESPVTVAITYGTAYASGVGSELQDRGADAAIIVSAFGSVSMRSTEETPIVGTICSGLGDGGHDVAAGYDPEIVLKKRDFLQKIQTGVMPEEAEITTTVKHWETRGKYTKRMVLERIERTFGVEFTPVE